MAAQPRTIVWRALVCGIAAAALSVPVSAQEAPAAATASGSSGSTPALNLTTWLGVGEDSTIADRRTEGFGGFGVVYSRARRRLSIVASFVGGGRIGSDMERMSNQAAGGTISWIASRRTTLDIGHRTSRAPVDPFSLARALGGSGHRESTTSLESRLATRPLVTSHTFVDLAHRVTRRSSIVLTQRSTIGGGSRVFQGGARFERRIVPNATLRAGYQFGSGGSSATRGSDVRTQLQAHDLNIEVDYAPPLSPNTIVSFGTGSSLVRGGLHGQVRLLATAAVAHTLNERWDMTVRYGRPVQYLEGVGTPVLSDRVDLEVAGDVSRRSRVQLVGGYSVGTEAFGVDKRVTSYLTSVSWESRLHRRTGVRVEASFGHSRFDENVVLPQGVARRITYVGLRAFATYSLPVRRAAK